MKSKRKIIEYRWDIAGCLVIIVIISLIGLRLNAWTGVLKGDDAYMHAGMVQYIIDNFPHLEWLHQYFNGYQPFQFYEPTFYCLTALISSITKLPVSLLFQVFLYLSIVGIGISAFILSRVLKIQRLIAIGFSLLIFTMSITWNHVVIGGAYNRVIALPYVFLSIALAYQYVRNINTKSVKLYIATIVVFTLLALLHPLIWQWTFIFILGIFIVGINGWKQKLYHIAKTILPVAGFSAWIYIPLFGAYGASLSSPAGGTLHDTTLMQLNWLIYLPSRNVWSIDLGPLILPLALIGLFLAGVYCKRIIAHRSVIRLELKIIALFIAFSMYFFAYGWLPMPKFTYLMAAYDYAFWLGVALIIFSFFTFAALSQARVFQKMWGHLKTFCEITFLPATVAACFIIIPFLQTFQNADNPANSNSYSSNIRQIVDIAVKNSDDNYRTYNAQRILSRWLYFADSSLNITGGRSGYVPHKYYSEWANGMISYRFATEQEIQKIYSEDRPNIWRSTTGGNNNYYSSMFWLDWYGASGPILLPSFYPQLENSLGYAGHPQFFQQYLSSAYFGDMFFYKYNGSSPITISTEAKTIAVPFQSGDAPELYTDFLDVLSSLNLNSQWIIPVKLDSAGSLAKFDTALVEYRDYITYKDILDDYIISGGHLIVTGVYNTPQSMLNASIDDVGLSFQVEASLLAAPDNSVILAQTPEGPIVYRTLVGKGTLTVMGMTLDALLESDSLAGIILLTEAVAPEISLSQIAAQLDFTSISYITPGTTGGISMSSGEPDQTVTASNFTVSWNTEKALGQINNSGETIVLTAEFRGKNTHNQVNFSAHLSDIVFTSSSGFVQFDIWTDGDPIIDACFESQDLDKYNGYRIQTKKGEWVHNILPLSAFNYPVGYFDTSQEFVFTVNDNQTTGLNGDGETVNIQIKNLSISTPDQPMNDGLFSLNFITDHSIDHNQINWTFPISQSVSADSNAIVRFSLWSDGSSISSIGVTLGQTGKNGYLYYDLPDHVWSGWQDFILPLSYFQWKEGDKIESVDAISLCFNDNVPYQMEAKIRQFRIDNIGIVAMNNPSSYNGLTGTWEQANRYVLTLDDNKNILWKESYMSSWIIKDNLGHEVDYYFAGPGMIYLVAPQNATSITFEMPVSKDRMAGIIISILSLFGFMVYLIVKFRTGQPSKKNLQKSGTFQ